MMGNAIAANLFSIIAIEKFIQATRDSGYKGTANAVAELVDNAIQAGATTIDVTILRVKGNADDEIEVTVQDDGCGMSPFILRNALRFGGSTRFNGRTGLGRYGMGLPNSSLSQSRRLTVYTWEKDSQIYSSYLDVDEISNGTMVEVPLPKKIERAEIPYNLTQSGTIIHWSNCDRLDYRRISTLSTKVSTSLGQKFRHYIWDGIKLKINGDPVEPIDPLFLHDGSKHNNGRQFGTVLEYEIKCGPEENAEKGTVQVRFSELPVHEWQRLANHEKRSMGITKGAGVSIIRAGREVDYGWFFLGGKRRENYDDWWRCEIQFDPILDEAFGITHTKQQIRPRQYLIDALTPDIETVARTLNARARKAHFLAKISEKVTEAEILATRCETLLEPLPDQICEGDNHLLQELRNANPAVFDALNKTRTEESRCTYKVVEATLRNMNFFNTLRCNNQIVLALNPDHPFYKYFYGPLSHSENESEQKIKNALDILLLSYARTEVAIQNTNNAEVMQILRSRWSNVLATFLSA